MNSEREKLMAEWLRLNWHPLDGLSLGQIPVAGSKRRSIAISLGGKLYKIGKIAPHKAFVVVRGSLKLLYVSPYYTNYRYAARKVFGGIDGAVDIDHVLGRKLTHYHGFMYTLVARLDQGVNRSHGRWESVPEEERKVLLDKFCYTDDRILAKVLEEATGSLPTSAWKGGYKVERSHDRASSAEEQWRARYALGMDGGPPNLEGLSPLEY